jgi:hypothetical protein
MKSKPLIVSVLPTCPEHLCVAASPYLCLQRRWGIAASLSRCLGGCSCDCHAGASYEARTHEAWEVLVADDEA